MLRQADLTVEDLTVLAVAAFVLLCAWKGLLDPAASPEAQRAAQAGLVRRHIGNQGSALAVPPMPTDPAAHPAETLAAAWGAERSTGAPILLATEKASVSFRPDLVTVPTMIAAVEDYGYQATETQPLSAVAAVAAVRTPLRHELLAPEREPTVAPAPRDDMDLRAIEEHAGLPARGDRDAAAAS